MKKQWKAKLGILLVLSLVLTMVMPTSLSAKRKAVKLSNKKITVKVGQKKTLKVKNSTKKAKWSIKAGKKNIKLTKKKKSSVVIVAKKKGSATVVAKVGKKKLTCKVTVKKADEKQPAEPTTEPTKEPVKATATPTATPTAEPTAEPTKEPVEDIVIDMTKLGDTTITVPSAINFSSQLDSRFDLKYFSKLIVEYTYVCENDDESDFTNGKIGLAATADTLTGYEDGVALSYGLAAGNSKVTVSLTGCDGPALGINVQPMNGKYAWPKNLTSITITSIKFVAKLNTYYPAPGEVVEPTPTPGPTYAPEEFNYEGVDTSWIDPNKPMVAFTFDDGPVGNSEDSNSIIIQDALAKYDAHATFFYIGSQINTEEKEAEIKRAHDMGFEVGNHSWGWDSLSSLKEAGIKDSIEKTNAKLKEITGYSNFLFRAPNLSISTAMKGYIKAPFINCAVDSKDYLDGSEDGKLDKASIIENVKKAQDGDIVLMHEFNTNTAKAIDEILDYFVNDMGYQVVSVSELYAVRGEKLMTGSVYSKCPPKAAE